MSADPPHTPWALIAGSSSGSTWVNNVLAGHPCATSVGEILMSNLTASQIFHSSAAGIGKVLQDIDIINRQTLHRRAAEPGAAKCKHTAGGVKLKLFERDIIVGKSQKGDENALKVAAALRSHGVKVLLLKRTNHLNNYLGRLSRHRTGVLHCRSGTKCDPSTLNISIAVNCKSAISSIDRLRLRMRASDLLFASDQSGTQVSTDGSSGVLQLHYEHLISTPQMWLTMMRFLDLPADSACLLTDTFQKRVLQTQREMIRNWHALSTCFEKSGPFYRKLLQPDQRPSSGLLPRDTRALCPSHRSSSRAGPAAE